MKKGESIINQVQGFVPLLYGAMVAIGMLFEYFRYMAFGVNIFQYADIFDFLIAPFKDFTIFIYLIATIFVVYIGYLVDKLMQQWPKIYAFLNFGLTKKSWFKTYTRLSFITVFGFYLFISSTLLAKINYQNVINQKHKVSILFADDKQIQGNLIGKTKEVIFLHQDEKIMIIPSVSLIKKIELID
jgi:hypothetical protein